MNGLRGLIGKETIAVPGAYDAASALLAQKAGFKAVYISGAGLSNSRGLPDTGLLNRDEVAKAASYIINATGMPAIVDADTGFGGPSEAAKTVKAFERIGAGAVQIEDQTFPKRCGHLQGKTLISGRAFAAKIRAAAKARKDRDFLIIARTDAASVEGLDGAIERARLYVEAGADVIFPEALAGKEEFLRFSSAIDAPVMANMTEFGKTPYLTVADFKRLGCSIVIFPMTSFRVAMKAMERALGELMTKGTQKGLLEKMQTRAELYKLLGYAAYKRPCKR